MHRNSRIDKVAAERPEPRQNPVLFGSSKPRIADHVGHQDRGQFSGFATALRRRDRISRFGSTVQSVWAASQRRERNVDLCLEHGRASMLR